MAERNGVSIAFEDTMADGISGSNVLSVEADVEHRNLHEQLREAFSRLAIHCRELLSLCWDERLRYEDIADLLAVPIGSIGPTRQRCLRSLRIEAGLT